VAKYAQDEERLRAEEGCETTTDVLSLMRDEAQQKFPDSNLAWLLTQMAGLSIRADELQALVTQLEARILELETEGGP